MKPPAANKTLSQIWIDEVRKGSKNGEQNGLSLLVDVENFNFAYTRMSTEGVKVAVHHHR